MEAGIMEWLENLLKDAKITDGKLDIPPLMAAVKKEFPGHAVPKQEFNEALEAEKKLENDIKTRDKQLEELKKETGNAEELQAQIRKLHEENKEAQKKYEACMKELKFTNAIKAALAGKAQDEDIVAGLVDREKLVVLEDGTVAGLDAQIKALQESKAFLFKSSIPPYSPAHGGVPRNLSDYVTEIIIDAKYHNCEIKNRPRAGEKVLAVRKAGGQGGISVPVS